MTEFFTLRRPLTRNPRLDHLATPDAMTALVQKFLPASDGMPPDRQNCEASAHRFPGLDHVAAAMGLSAVPARRRECYPPRALPGQHPKTFLQWGWSLRPGRQVLFEIGTVSAIVSLHFLKTIPSSKTEPWHLEDIIIDTGQRETYQLSPDDPSLAGHRTRLISAIASSVSALNDDDWQMAESGLHAAIRDITRALDDVADAHHAEHAAAMQAVRPQPSRP